MEAFYTAVGITFGILLPVIVVAILVAFVITVRSLPIWMQERADELKKLPPYDDVRIIEDIENKTWIVEFYKGDTCVWSGKHNFRKY